MDSKPKTTDSRLTRALEEGYGKAGSWNPAWGECPSMPLVLKWAHDIQQNPELKRLLRPAE